MTTKRPSQRLSGPFMPFPRWLLDYLSGDGTTALVMLGVLRYMNVTSQKLTVPYDVLANDLGISRSTVIRSINKLVDLGVLVRKQRAVRGRSISNEYTVNFNNPEALGVSPVDPLGVSPMTPYSVTHDTPEGVTHDTQTRIKNKNKILKRDEGRIDPRLGV